MPFNEEDHRHLFHLLQGQPTSLPAALAEQVLQCGALLLLEEEASPTAIETLSVCAIQSPNPEVRHRALNALLRLTRKHPQATQALYRMALELDSDEARKALTTRPHLPAPSPQQAAALSLLQTPFRPPNHQALLEYFLSAAPPLRQRLLQAAQTALPSWTVLASALDANTPEAYQALVQAYPHFDEAERTLARSALLNAFQQGQSLAGNALCEYFLQHEDTQAAALAQQHNCAPTEPDRRALFYFLSEQWAAYQQLDFNHALLNTLYEQAPRSLRRRLLTLSRYSGQIDWLQTRPRLLSDLSDADWQSVLSQLQQRADWSTLWRLAQSAPPLWSAAIVPILAAAAWQPAEVAEQTLWAELRTLAQQVQPPQVQSIRTLETLTSDVTCLALSPGGRLLIAGSSENTLQRWRIPQGENVQPPIYAPAANTRALAFDPSGQFLVAALSDHSLRIFRTDDGRVIKTLTGHRGMVRSLVISPDSRTLFSAGFDGSLYVWRFPLGPQERELARIQGEWFGLGMSSDGQFLLGGGNQGLLRVWNWPQGSPLHDLPTPHQPLTCLAVSPSGQLCASAGRTSPITLQNFISGQQLASLPSPSQVTALCLHPNEQLLFSGDLQGNLTIWNLSTARPLACLSTAQTPITSLLLSPDGRTLFSSEAGKTITLWKLDSLLLTRQPLDSPPQRAIAELEAQRTQATAIEQDWLTLRLLLLRWKARFDIALAEPTQVQLSDFDITIE